MNGQQKAQFYAEKVRHWLATSPKFPRHPNGSVNQTELSRVLGIPRDSLYKNTAVLQLLTEFTKKMDESRNAIAREPVCHEQMTATPLHQKGEPTGPVAGSITKAEDGMLKLSKALKKREDELHKLKEGYSLMAIESDAKSEIILRLKRQLFREQETFASGRLWRDL